MNIFFKFVSFLLYPTEVKRLKCAMLGTFIVTSLSPHVGNIFCVAFSLIDGLLWMEFCCPLNINTNTKNVALFSAKESILLTLFSSLIGSVLIDTSNHKSGWTPAEHDLTSSTAIINPYGCHGCHTNVWLQISSQ